ncbi:MAG: monovalent cation/H(+) antiporter subunit G [Sandaracinaceae bacterium]
MTLALEIIGSIFLFGGIVFCTIGGIGLVRLPDFYSRCHAAGMTDSAGAGGVLVGLCFFAPPLVIVKLLTILVFIWLSSTVSTHALVKAAYARGLRLEQPRVRDWVKPAPSDAAEEPPDTERGVAEEEE